jgi:uncharacterized protein (TIGR02145 family)
MMKQQEYPFNKRKTNVICLFFILPVLYSCSKKENNYVFFYPSYETIRDADSNEYHTVYILGQTWMVENLKTTRYHNGEAIPKVEDPGAWEALTTGAYSDYNNDPQMSKTYGRLYNWTAATRGNLCPYPFHVPWDHDWQQLVDTLGGSNVAGGALKETGTAHWQSNFGATDRFGFKALPGGSRDTDGAFAGLGLHGSWWGNSVSLELVLARSVHGDNPTTDRSEVNKKAGFSVRCVRDY